MGSTPKAPKQTAAQKAFDIEQQKALNEETISENRKRKALVRGTLGAKSLLSGAEAGVAAPLDGGTNGVATPPTVSTGTPKRIKKPGAK